MVTYLERLERILVALEHPANGWLLLVLRDSIRRFKDLDGGGYARHFC